MNSLQNKRHPVTRNHLNAVNCSRYPDDKKIKKLKLRK